MKKIIFAGFIFSAVFLATFQIVFAHPGRTDSSGGHWDHSTGEYHYHHGYPAHQHVDDVCPYDFDDQTNHNEKKPPAGDSSGSSSGSSDSGKSSGNNFIEEITYVFFIVVFIAFLCSALSDPKTKNPKKKPATKPKNISYDYQKYIRQSQMQISNKIETKNIVPEYGQTPIPNVSHSKELEKPRLVLDCSKMYNDKYGGKTFEEIAHLCGMPDNVFLDEACIPHSKGYPNNDEYTFYISEHGKCFHKKCGCRNATKKMNAVALSKLTPCSICKPHRPNLLWYYTYLDVLENLNRYGIQIKSNDQLPPS